MITSILIIRPTPRVFIPPQIFPGRTDEKMRVFFMLKRFRKSKVLLGYAEGLKESPYAG